MHNVLLFRPDDSPFDVAAIRHAFEVGPGFRNVRTGAPYGSAIEADYVEPESRTTAILNGKLDTISIRGVSDASLRAALILQSHLNIPLRMVDTGYTFDLILEGVATVAELWSAIENARKS